jgi:hypothetical protein
MRAVVVCTYGSEMAWESSCIYTMIFACVNEKLWFLCIDVSALSKMCVMRYAHLAQPRGQSGNQSASQYRLSRKIFAASAHWF